MKSLSERLIQLRMQTRVTQQELGDMIGKSVQAYQKYEYGTSQPSNDALLTYASFYNVSVQYLVTGEKTGKKYKKEPITPFEQQVKTLRKKAGLTQKQAAEELGIRLTAYQAYEYGQSEPTLENLLKLAELLGVTLDELLGRTELE